MESFELGELAAKHILELESDHDEALVLVSSIYAREQRWDHVKEGKTSNGGKECVQGETS